jgi:hypothetical protein
MSDYKKMKKSGKANPLADSLAEAMSPSKAHSRVGGKSFGDYFNMKQGDGIKDVLNERFGKLRAKMKKKK